MQEARAAGCRTAAEANRFIEQKREKEAEESLQRMESAQAGPCGKVFPRPNYLKNEADGSLSKLDDWDIGDFPGAQLLSETVCS